MASKKATKVRSAKPAKTCTVAAKPSEVMKVPNAQEFKRVLNAVKAHEKDKDSAVGSLREVIANAVQKHHVDKRAFAMYRALDKLPGGKLKTTLDHLDHYREIGGLDRRALEQEQMFDRKAELDAAGAAIGKVIPRKKKNGDARTGSFQQKMREAGQAAETTQPETEAATASDAVH